MKLVTLSVYVDEAKLDNALRTELATHNDYEFEKWIKSKSLDQKLKHQFHWLHGSGIKYNQMEDNVNDDNNPKSA